MHFIYLLTQSNQRFLGYLLLLKTNGFLAGDKLFLRAMLILFCPHRSELMRTPESDRRYTSNRVCNLF